MTKSFDLLGDGFPYVHEMATLPCHQPDKFVETDVTITILSYVHNQISFRASLIGKTQERHSEVEGGKRSDTSLIK